MRRRLECTLRLRFCCCWAAAEESIDEKDDMDAKPEKLAPAPPPPPSPATLLLTLSAMLEARGRWFAPAVPVPDAAVVERPYVRGPEGSSGWGGCACVSGRVESTSELAAYVREKNATEEPVRVNNIDGGVSGPLTGDAGSLIKCVVLVTIDHRRTWVSRQISREGGREGGKTQKETEKNGIPVPREASGCSRKAPCVPSCEPDSPASARCRGPAKKEEEIKKHSRISCRKE